MKTITYKAAKTIDLTKGEDFRQELQKLYINRSEYYINVFEGNHALMQFKMSFNRPRKIIDFSGATGEFISKTLKKSLNSNSTIIEVEVKGAVS